jgi:F0F1-type ATP synthase membrane subunit b/b'
LAELAAARQRSDAVVQDAKSRLASDVEAAKASLARDSELLADQIAESILRRNAA